MSRGTARSSRNRGPPRPGHLPLPAAPCAAPTWPKRISAATARRLVPAPRTAARTGRGTPRAVRGRGPCCGLHTVSEAAPPSSAKVAQRKARHLPAADDERGLESRTAPAARRRRTPMEQSESGFSLMCSEVFTCLAAVTAERNTRVSSFPAEPAPRAQASASCTWPRISVLPQHQGNRGPRPPQTGGRRASRPLRLKSVGASAGSRSRHRARAASSPSSAKR